MWLPEGGCLRPGGLFFKGVFHMASLCDRQRRGDLLLFFYQLKCIPMPSFYPILMYNQPRPEENLKI
jgi:hypothetical protein